MRSLIRNRVVGAALVALALVATACGSGDDSTTVGASTTGGAADGPTIIVGSTNFGEQLILGEIYAQVLEANGYSVERKFNLGSREVVNPQLRRRHAEH